MILQMAVEVLNGRIWKSRSLVAKVAPFTILPNRLNLFINQILKSVVIYRTFFLTWCAQVAAPALDPLFKRKRPSEQDIAKIEAKKAKRDASSLEQRSATSITT